MKRIKDARIRAAAPELLAALDQAYLDILTFLNEGDFKRDVEWDAGYIVDAIAKAKGGKGMKLTDQLKMLLIFWDVIILVGGGLLFFIGYLGFHALQEILGLLCQTH